MTAPRVIGVSLFGSRARGDHHPGSDVDLLMWTEGGAPEATIKANLALSFYPREMLLEMASKGDLFAGHLATEAMEIWDPEGLLRELREAYTPSEDLDQVISNASDLGRLLLDRARHFPPDLFNRRAAWVVRTILTARRAREGEIAYAAAEILRGTGSAEAERVLKVKNCVEDVDGLPEALERFLCEFGQSDLPKSGLQAWARRFEGTGNSFALKTLRQLDCLEPATVYA